MHALITRARPVATFIGYVELAALVLFPLTFLPVTLQRVGALVAVAAGVYKLRGRIRNRRAGVVPPPPTPARVTPARIFDQAQRELHEGHPVYTSEPTP